MEQTIQGEQPTVEGSPYGKFANLEDLKNAYENLEKEFTRKSQILSELKKENEKNQNQDKTSQTQNQTTMESIVQTQQTEEKDFWENEKWQQDVDEFLEENPLAQNYAQQISQMVLEDKSLKSKKRPLEKAWIKLLEKNLKTPDEFLKDQQFFDQILANENVKTKIISDYLKNLNNREKTPPLFASSGVSGVIPESKKPKTLDDVKELAKKIFSN